MKEDVAEASKMLNKNWVLKRKRRKIPSGLDSSTVKEENSQPLESVLNNPSSKRGVKDEVASTRSSSKKKGNDGVSFSFCSFFTFIVFFGGNSTKIWKRSFGKKAGVVYNRSQALWSRNKRTFLMCFFKFMLLTFAFIQLH